EAEASAAVGAPHKAPGVYAPGLPRRRVRVEEGDEDAAPVRHHELVVALERRSIRRRRLQERERDLLQSGVARNRERLSWARSTRHSLGRSGPIGGGARPSTCEPGRRNT